MAVLRGHSKATKRKKGFEYEVHVNGVGILTAAAGAAVIMSLMGMNSWDKMKSGDTSAKPGWYTAFVTGPFGKVFGLW